VCVFLFIYLFGERERTRQDKTRQDNGGDEGEEGEGGIE
jgi:hypothetical protein